MIGDVVLRDHTGRVRQAAVEALVSYDTIAGDNVQAERLDAVPSSRYPIVLVYADDSAVGGAPAGTAPYFDVTCHMIVQVLVQHAQLGDAVDALDTLIEQVKDGLFGDPNWVRLTENISSFRVTRSFKDGDRITGDGRILIEMTWRERYPPRITQPLRKIDVTVAPSGGAPTLQVEIDLLAT